jgi:hypothetical protein
LAQTGVMHPTEALTRLGGVADLRTLRRVTSRRKLRTALRKGQVVKAGYGHYALPTGAMARSAAARLAGTVSHRSAALDHGWEVGTQPDLPDVIVPRNRKVEPARRHGIDVRWRDLEPDEVHGLVTSHYRTVIDCAKDLPFTEALAVADSALRHGDVEQDELIRRARRLRGPGSAKVLRVATEASAKAANPFESMLRAIALDVPGLAVEPQVWIEDWGLRVRPDLVDGERRLVVEAESFEFHTGRRAFRRDCERYTGLVIRGWRVVRFAWEHVMFQQDFVRACLVSLVEGPPGRAEPAPEMLLSA